MSEWTCVGEPALRSTSGDFDSAAADFASTTRLGTATSEAAVTAALGGFEGFEGALADGFGTLLRTVGDSLNDVPTAAANLDAAFAAAAPSLTVLKTESDEIHEDAISEHGIVVEARAEYITWSTRVSWLGRALNDAAASRDDAPSEVVYQDTRRSYNSAVRRRDDESERRDAASAALDELQVRFDRVRTDEDDIHDDVATAVRAVDLEQGLDQCAISDPGMPGMGVVIDMIDAAIISIGTGRGGDAARAQLRNARDSIAGFAGFNSAQRDDIVERERVLMYGSPQDVRDYYLNKALEEAGIDINEWDPSQGLDRNAHIVENVYEYYADLYRGGTDHLWWSGMAALIGPSFYGGFQDLETFSDLLGYGSDIAGYANRIPGNHQIPAAVTELSGEALEGELRWYQHLLLEMQQEIFFDMGPAHEAYNDVGMRGIEAMLADDPYQFGPETIEAWQQIDDGHRLGDVDLIAEGNRTLLRREQWRIIDDDYERMRDRPTTGEATTYLMTTVGAPSVPGALSYPEVFPLEFDATQYVGTPRQVPVIPFVYSQDVPHVGAEGTVTVMTPLPDGNIASFDDRWALIEADTLPTYVDLAENHPDQVLDVLDTPVGERADAFTFGEWWDDVAVRMIEDFDVDFDVELQAGL